MESAVFGFISLVIWTFTVLHTPISSCSQFGGLAHVKVQAPLLGIMREQWRRQNLAYSPRETHDVSYIIRDVIVCCTNSNARQACSNSSWKYARCSNKSVKLPASVCLKGKLPKLCVIGIDMATQTKRSPRSEGDEAFFIFLILSAHRRLNRTSLWYFPRSLLKKVLNFFFRRSSTEIGHFQPW